MVGGFVQQQDVAGRHQRAREIQAHAPAARERPPACRVWRQQLQVHCSRRRRGQWRQPSSLARRWCAAATASQSSARAGRRPPAGPCTSASPDSTKHRWRRIGQRRRFLRDAGDAQAGRQVHVAACRLPPRPGSRRRTGWTCRSRCGPDHAQCASRVQGSGPDSNERSPRRRARKKDRGDLEGARIVPERRMAWPYGRESGVGASRAGLSRLHARGRASRACRRTPAATGRYRR